jgi:hypothetical protein
MGNSGGGAGERSDGRIDRIRTFEGNQEPLEVVSHPGLLYPARWMSGDGTTLHLVVSGDDCFSVRKAILTVAE